jgi:carbon storage regulator
MLVLTRRAGEEIVIGDDIRLTVVRIRGNNVRLGISAPAETRVRRSELRPVAHQPRAQDSSAGTA